MESSQNKDYRTVIEKYHVPVTKESISGHCSGCIQLHSELFKIQFKQSHIELCPICFIGLKNGIRELTKAHFKPIPLIDPATKEQSGE